jgi:hypothetical protein
MQEVFVRKCERNGPPRRLRRRWKGTVKLDNFLLGCEVAKCDEYVPTFQKNLLSLLAEYIPI